MLLGPPGNRASRRRQRGQTIEGLRDTGLGPAGLALNVTTPVGSLDARATPGLSMSSGFNLQVHALDTVAVAARTAVARTSTGAPAQKTPTGTPKTAGTTTVVKATPVATTTARVAPPPPPIAADVTRVVAVVPVPPPPRSGVVTQAEVAARPPPRETTDTPTFQTQTPAPSPTTTPASGGAVSTAPVTVGPQPAPATPVGQLGAAGFAGGTGSTGPSLSTPGLPGGAFVPPPPSQGSAGCAGAPLAVDHGGLVGVLNTLETEGRIDSFYGDGTAVRERFTRKDGVIRCSGFEVGTFSVGVDPRNPGASLVRTFVPAPVVEQPAPPIVFGPPGSGVADGFDPGVKVFLVVAALVAVYFVTRGSAA